MLWWGSYPNLNAYIILILICTDIHSGQCLCRPNCDSNIQWRNPMIVPCIRMIFAYYVYIFLHIQYGSALLILFSCFCFECPENNWFSWRTIGVSWVALWPAVSWFCGSCPSFPLCKCQLFSYQITCRHNWSKRHAQTMQSRKCLNRFLCSPLRCCLHVKKTSVLGPVSSRTGHKASGTFGFNRIQTEISLEEGRFTQYQPMSPQTCYVLMLVNWYLCELVDVGEHQPNHTKPTPRSSFQRFGHEHRVLGGFPVLFGSLLTRHPALPSSG